MTKIYCIVCDKYRKFKNPKISCILKKLLGLSIVCSKWSNEYKKKTFKEEKSIQILKIIDLIVNIE